MPKTVTKPATYEDLLKVPDHLVAEIVDGELFASPMLGSRAALTKTRLAALLMRSFDYDASSDWWMLVAPELHLVLDVLVPVIAAWRRARKPKDLDRPCDIAPDWVCEVTSPATGRLDRLRKMPKYAANSIPHLWLIDPIQKTLEIYRLQNGSWLLVGTHGEDDRVRAEPFDAIELALQPLWSD